MAKLHGKGPTSSSFFQPFSSYHLVAILFFHLYPIVTSLPQDEAAITAAPARCDTVSCLDFARESKSCTGSGSTLDNCVCDKGHFVVPFSRCLTSDPACGEEVATSAVKELQSSCSPYYSSASSLCEECFDSVAKDLSCLNGDDVRCLCRPRPTGYLELLTSCTSTNTKNSVSCHASELETYTMYLDPGCLAVSTAKQDENCLLCEAAIATEVGCDGPDDHSCLCDQDDYTGSLFACIESESECVTEQITPARDDYETVCSLFSIGAEASILEDDPFGPTDSASLSDDDDLDDLELELDRIANDNNNNDDDDDGPDTATVVGAVAGAVAGLSLLLLGGYYLFRKRTQAEKFEKQKPHKSASQPQSVPGSISTGQDGMYEMWGSHESQQKYAASSFASVPPPRPGVHEANGTFAHQYELGGGGGGGGGGNGGAMMYPQGQMQGHYPHGPASELASPSVSTAMAYSNGRPPATMPPQGFVELGPSR